MQPVVTPPLLTLRPRLITTWRRLRMTSPSFSELARTVFLLSFALALMVALGFGAFHLLQALHEYLPVMHIPPSLPLSLILLVLHLLLLISNAVTALGALFQAHDLDILLASPQRPSKIFAAKLIETTVSASWMAAIFGLPALLGVGIYYDASWLYYLSAISLGVLYLLIPTAVGMITVLAFLRFVPVRSTSQVTAGLVISGGIVATILVLLTRQAMGILDGGSELLKLVFLFSSAQSLVFPSYWVAQILSATLVAEPLSCLPLIGALIFLATALVALAAGAFFAWHRQGMSVAQSSTGKPMRITEIVLLLASTPYRLLSYFSGDKLLVPFVQKELRTYLRDLMQIAQLGMLLSLTVVYLANFKLMSEAQSLSDAAARWWRTALIVLNVVMGLFVITAVASRFVFTSVSLEGTSFWALRKAPLSMLRYLNLKTLTFLLPLECIGCGLFVAGGLAISAPLEVIAFSALIGMIVIAGITALAVGLGAYFANFSWEHPGQLAASFGSLVFMLTAVGLITVTVTPAILLYLIFAARMDYLSLAAVLYILLVVLVSRGCATRAITSGARHLEEISG